MKTPSMLLVLGLLVSVPACDDTGGDGNGGSAGVGAGTSGSGSGNGSGAEPSNAAVSSCRDACDRLQFFDCIDADTHADCWNTCPDRTEDDLDLFASCVSNSVPSCDPGCLDNLIDAPEPDPTGSDDPANTCVSVCQSYVDAGCDIDELGEISSCALVCAELSEVEQAVIVLCFDSPETCEVDPGCLDGGGEEGGGEEGGAGEGG